MRIPPRIARIGALSALATTLLIGGPAVAATPTSTSTAPTASVSISSVVAVGDICYSALPAQAHDTLKLIETDGPYPYPQDGTVFQNREKLLPQQPQGYYHEYTVKTPGSPDRGARRIVTGDRSQEDYYTADHYKSFDFVDHGC
ncbi:ribonuclease domain-containing protein [Streptomyces zagrosensis]|uniref:Ribonuclease T1 n=1 Tax=Streptomyces zagrosensis TaxID=1042984 RepID=A0A7W9Q9Q0_9ACTN|nr:ribonuclease domain-containing protein [Streptomyces zagrosensis]MBB5936221.1 ribonuclease T1 [Streptomyces zagrosensis]